MTPLRDFPRSTRTDRDFEIPMLTAYAAAHGPFASVLDVGAHWSVQYYAPLLRSHTAVYHGVDVLPPDERTAAILDEYVVANANEHPWDRRYDLVVCCSTIEHAGVSTYHRDAIADEQWDLFGTCFDLAARRLWISFPVGRPYVVPDQLSVITAEQLSAWTAKAESHGATVRARFGFNPQGPQAGTVWVEHDDAGFACEVEYLDHLGNRSLCILEIDKGGAA